MQTPSYHHQRFPENCQLEFERCRKCSRPAELLQSSCRIASECGVVCDSAVLPHPAHHIHPVIGLDWETLPHLARP